MERPSWSVELKELRVLAAPVTTTYVLGYLVPFATVIFVGHLGSQELAAALLASLLCNVMGFSLSVGLLSAMDTLCSQAYGAKNYVRVGHVFQRALAITFTFISPLMVLWYFADHALILAGQERSLAELAVKYTRYRIIQMPAYVGFEAFRRFLQAQEVVQPMLWLSVFALPLHVVLLYFLTGHLGFIGAPISEIITMWWQLAVLVLYVCIFKPHTRACWGGWDLKEAFREWKPYLALGLPGLLMLCMEWWSFDILALGVGQLGETDLAAHGILAILAPLSYMVPLGVNTAVATRIGICLGEGRYKFAKMAAKLGVAIVYIAALLVACIFNFCRAYIPHGFNHDPGVVQAASGALPYLALFTIFNYTQGIGQGILRGTGKQKIGAIGVLVGSYAVAVPLAFYLGLGTSLGFHGFWIGFSIGYLFLSVLFAVFITRFDWVKLAHEARARSAASNQADLEAASEERKPLVSGIN